MSLLARAKRIYGRLQADRLDWKTRGIRAAADHALSTIPSGTPPLVDGKVLVECFWQHPNYLFRYGIVRSALGIRASQEVAVLGQWARRPMRQSLAALGIRQHLTFGDFAAATAPSRTWARGMLDRLASGDDIHSWKLPLGIPGFDLYDALLKIQRRADVDKDHHENLGYLTEWHRHIDAARRLLDKVRPSLVVMSHTQSANDYYAAIAFAALERNIRILLPRGAFGSLQPVSIRKVDDVFRFADSASPEDLAKLSDDQRDGLSALGREALFARLTGHSKEFAGHMAFGGSNRGVARQELCNTLGWKADKPIVAILTSTWFDFPHIYGSTRFANFREWIRETLKVAARNKDVNFLVRGHPVDRWYDGVYVDQVVHDLLGDNIGLCPYGIDGASVMAIVNAMITFYGSAAIEYAAMGKPVMVADQGWYHRHGFALLPPSREAYFDNLTRHWWTDIDLQAAADRAVLFAGHRLCHPAWLGGFLFGDDVMDQISAYRAIPSLLLDHADAVSREKALLREWFVSGERLYHPFKMRRSTDFKYS